MNNITETSLFAYETIKHDLSNRQQQVYDLISRHKQIIAKDIAFMLGLKINQVTGRINELMYDKQTIKINSIVDVDGRKRYAYAIRSELDPINKRNLTPDQKFEAFKSWIKTKQFVTSDNAIRFLDKLAK